jgi:hypothetical protein
MVPHSPCAKTTMRVPGPLGTEPCVDNTVTMTAFSDFKRCIACSIQFTLAVHSKGFYLSFVCPPDFVGATIMATAEYAKDKGLP